ncbi:YhfC family intramembrane metalloprotease [Paraburkholderia phymatum]|uniref:Putative transmembrane lipoprotein n=1 Tax=Paraburkholderia phymatum (strain DSM 17167 / CIP 108236 / LMG 21445 / STM815) TaxID=391038 RepID=B2JHU0_PARP8|nr:YhfC family intramembrane metalloprotease [Paraburkholderia phymatum]ACC70432.1 putative transmembrane lipoprotein [Paraburkholderia phymatum STM815]
MSRLPVSPVTLAALAAATIFVALLPIFLYRRWRAPFGLNRRGAILGIAVFALSAMLVERALNDYLLRQNAAASEWLSDPLAFVVYGALAAGICEEVGRFIAMRWLARRNTDPTRTDGTALAYGLGHGGAQVWLVGVMVQAQWIAFGVLDNRGQLDAYLGDLPAGPLMRIHLLLASLSPATAGVFVIERVAALVFQIGLSVLMWRGVQAGWRAILPVAIAAHALIDVPAAMSQAGRLSLMSVDAIYAVAAIVVAAVLIRFPSRASRAV